MKRPIGESYRSLLVFWVLNAPVFLFLFLRFGREAVSLADKKAGLYFLFLCIAQAGLISWILLVLIPGVLFLLCGRKISPLVFSAILAPLALFFLVLDSVIYSQFHLHFQWVFLQMVLSPARAQIFNLTSGDIISLVVLLLGFIGLELLLAQITQKFQSQRQRWISAIVTGILSLWVMVQGVYIWADAVYEPQILSVTQLPPWFVGITAKRFLERHHWIDTRQRPVNVSSLSKNQVHYPQHPLVVQTVTTKPNILLLAIDAWRADSMNATITPHIAALSKSATVYQNHFSGGNSTRAGLFSLFYSLSPSLFDTFYREAQGPLLFDILHKQNYYAQAYTSASALSPPFHRTAFVNLRGFNPTLNGEDSVARDRAVTQGLIASIDQAQALRKPFFAFGFYDSAHAYNFPLTHFKAPFQPSKRVSRLSLSKPENGLLLRHQYNNALFFIDQLMGEVIAHLREKKLLDNTLIIITADHGEEFDDNHQGYWGHNSNFTAVQTQVPLVVHWPQQSQHQVSTHLTSHYDIIPTLFSQFLGVSNRPSDYSIGKNLNDSSKRSIILMGNYSIIAALSVEKRRLAVTNALGYFQMQNLQGLVMNEPLDGEMVMEAYHQMQQFLK